MLEYVDLERSLREEAVTIEESSRDWTAAEVSRKLNEIADLLTNIRRQHRGGIDASMGKRSGSSMEG